MTADAKDVELGLYILLLAGFLGYHLITRVPPLLHTPLMSATNAISGISLVGSIVVAGSGYSPLSTILGCAAVACSSTNVVGGFLITDRMLRMFRSGREPDARQKRTRVATIALAGTVIALLAALGGLYATGVLHRGHAGSIIGYLYILSAALVILGLKGLSSPRWARAGMFSAGLGMLVAVAGTLFHDDIERTGYLWIFSGLAVGSVAGAIMGLRIPMTAVPQRTAFSHSLGALAAALVGVSEYLLRHDQLSGLQMTPLGFEVVIGTLTFAGSLVAAAKLQGWLPGVPITYRGQNVSNIALLIVTVGVLVAVIAAPGLDALFWVMVGLSLVFGISFVIPIGAADMPVVIALLNAYGGLADVAMGFVLMNKIQIITGSLDGTSGLLLSLLMCRAMNRSPVNVLFGAFGKVAQKAAGGEAKGTVKSITAEELAVLFEDARSVVIVPGYGMAVAQAQHAVSDLAKLLQKRGIDVKYAIHPVAGRMPGHMNVVLAEADVPYDQLYELEQINPFFAETDVALVVGANDVTNPAAKRDRTSPLYGMPIIEVERARAIVVLKRSMSPGFAGVDNDLYYDPKCMMLFGDAKESLNKLFAALRG